MVSDSLVESVDLSDFYESTISSGYYLEIFHKEKSGIFQLNEIQYDSKSKTYTLEMTSESRNINSLICNDKIVKISISQSGNSVFSIDSENILSLSYSAGLTGNSSLVTMILEIV